MLLWPQIFLKLLQPIHEFPFLLHLNVENQLGCQKPLPRKALLLAVLGAAPELGAGNEYCCTRGKLEGESLAGIILGCV